MVITEHGCVKHKRIEFIQDKNGIAVWFCLDCGHELPQYEDCGSGC